MSTGVGSGVEEPTVSPVVPVPLESLPPLAVVVGVGFATAAGVGLFAEPRLPDVWFAAVALAAAAAAAA